MVVGLIPVQGTPVQGTTSCSGRGFGPGQGTWKKQVINVSLSHQCIDVSLPLFISSFPSLLQKLNWIGNRDCEIFWKSTWTFVDLPGLLSSLVRKAGSRMDNLERSFFFYKFIITAVWTDLWSIFIFPTECLNCGEWKGGFL